MIYISYSQGGNQGKSGAERGWSGDGVLGEGLATLVELETGHILVL